TATPVETVPGNGEDAAKPEAPDDALGAASEAVDAARKAAAEAEARKKAAEQAATVRRQPPKRRIARQPRPVVPAHFVVRDIVFSPSGYLTDEDLAGIRSGFIGATMRADKVAPLLEAINARYAERGAVLAQAVLRGVDAANGRIHVELFEARLGQVTYKAQILSPRYLAMRTGIRSGDLADVKTIQRRLDRLSLTDGIRVIANFAPGAERGLTDLELVVAEPRRFTGSVGVDNYGNPSTGEVRANFAARWRGPTGWNDAIDVSGYRSERAFSATAAYGITVTPSGTRLGAYGTYEWSITEVFPKVKARTETVGLTASQPLVVTEAVQLSFDARAFAFIDRSWIAGPPLSDQRGVGGYAGLSGAVTRAGFTLRGGGGLQVINWEDRLFGSGHETSVAATVTLAGLQRLPLGFAATASLGAQYAFHDPVPSDYRTTVASYAAVRGYPESLSSGDSGFFLRTQLERAEPITVPLNQIAGGGDARRLELRPFLFHDIGRAYDVVGGNQQPQDLLQSVGAGLSFNIADIVIGDVYAAMPLRDANGFNADNDWDFRFSVSVALQ
ncbi:MAG: ShlB/FhaC/HecB family hemolysin secretion/activation protein, partial [Rhodobiaceae bacterium]|nr:ShlB/FhaC/HecB family hemolysin secretion/activation protein [Rhodobiaceae bacterium]